MKSLISLNSHISIKQSAFDHKGNNSMWKPLCSNHNEKQFAHIPNFLSFFSGNFLKKSWFNNSLIDILCSGFFCKQENKKLIDSSQRLTYDGILISSLIILINSSSFVILNGFYPINSSYIMTPNDHISIF